MVYIIVWVLLFDFSVLYLAFQIVDLVLELYSSYGFRSETAEEHSCKYFLSEVHVYDVSILKLEGSTTLID